MRLLEKLVLSILLLAFVVNFIASESVYMVLDYSLFGTMVMYLFGSIYIFRAKKAVEILISSISGLGIVLCLILTYGIIRTLSLQYSEIPIVITGSCFLFYMVIGIFYPPCRLILKRVVVRHAIFALIAFFLMFMPLENELYRKFLVVNNLHKHRINEFLLKEMHIKGADEALGEEDCLTGLEHAQQARSAALRWKNISEEAVSHFENGTGDFQTIYKKNPLHEIQDVYINLYKAYECKGTQKTDPGEKFTNFLLADNYLNACSYEDEGWEQEKLWSKLNLAETCASSGRKDLLPSLLKKIDELADKFTEPRSFIRSRILSRKAEIYSSIGAYLTSNELIDAATDILRQDTTDVTNYNELTFNLSRKGYNHILMGDFKKGREELNKVLALSRLSNTRRAVVLYRLAASYYLEDHYVEAKNRFKKVLEEVDIDAPENYQLLENVWYMLAKCDLATAKYTDCRKEIVAARQMNKKLAGTDSPDVSIDILEAKLYAIHSDFDDARILLENSLSNATEKASIYLELSRIELISGNAGKAEQYFNEFLYEAGISEEISQPSGLSQLLKAAWIKYAFGDYEKSELYYQGAESIIRRYDIQKESHLVQYSNGKGLICLAKLQLDSARQFFQSAIERQVNLTGANHPDWAVLNLNYARLKKYVNEADSAEEMLNQSLAVLNRHFTEPHYYKGDVLYELAELKKEQGKTVEAKTLYLQAVENYIAVFDEEHYKVLKIKEILDQDKKM